MPGLLVQLSVNYFLANVTDLFLPCHPQPLVLQVWEEQELSDNQVVSKSWTLLGIQNSSGKSVYRGTDQGLDVSR